MKKEKSAYIKNIYLEISTPGKVAAQLFDSSQQETLGNFMCGDMYSHADDIGFAILMNNGVSIAFTLKKDTVLSLIHVLGNAVLDGETKQ